MTNPVKIPGGVSISRDDDAVINLNEPTVTPVDVEGASMSAVEPTVFETIKDRIPDVSIYWSGARRLRLGAARERGLDINLSPESMYDRLEREGLAQYMTPEDFESFADVKTTSEFDLKVEYLSNRIMSEKQLTDKGFVKSLIGEAVAYSADPITLTLDAVAGGSGKGRLLYRFMSGGARAAAVNGVVESLLTIDERAYRPQDIGFAMAAAFGVGGVFGAALGRRADSPSVPTNRSVPFSEKVKPLDSPVPPKQVFDTPSPAATRIAPDLEQALDPLNKRTNAEAPAGQSVDDPTVGAPVNARVPNMGDTAELVLEQNQVAKYVPEETPQIDPKLQERASRRLTEDQLIEIQEAVDDLSVVENPSNAQLNRLDRLTKKLDDHAEAIKAADELETLQNSQIGQQLDNATIPSSVQQDPFIDELLNLFDGDGPSSLSDADVFIDPGLSRSVGADVVEGAEIMRDTAFGIAQNNADEIVDSADERIVAGEVPIFEQLLSYISPALRANLVKNTAIRTLLKYGFTRPFKEKDADVNRTGWEDKARRRFLTPEGKRLRVHRQAFTEWFSDIRKQRNLLKSPAFLRFDLEQEFAKEVGKAVQSLNSGNTPNVHPAVLKAANAFDQFGEDLWGQLQRSGVVPADMPRPKKYYLPQIIDRQSTRQFVNQFSSFRVGLDALTDLYRRALNVRLRQQLVDLIEEAGDSTGKLIDDLTESLTDVISRAMARRAYSHDLSAVGMEEVDAFGIHLDNVENLRTLLTDNLVKRAPEGTDITAISEQIDSIIASLTRQQSKSSTGPTPDRLKRRVDLDMDATLDYTTLNGEKRTVRLGDLYEQDVNTAAHRYGRWAAAESTLAEDGTSIRQIKQVIDELETQQSDSAFIEDAPTKEDIRLLKYMYRAVMQLPAHDVPETLMRVTNALKNMAYAVKMGASFLHTFSEAYTIAAQMGVGTVLKEMPTLVRIIKAYQKGTIEPGLHEAINAMNGAVFSSLEISLAGSRFDTDLHTFNGGRFLRGFERTAEGFKRTLSYLNLLPATTDIVRAFATVLQLKQLDDFLMGKKMPSFFDGIRRQYGLTDEAAEQLRSHFRSSKVIRNADGSLDWNGDIGLEAMPAEARLALEDFLYRAVTTMIQEVHRGNIPMLMTGPVGGVVLQFRSFEIASTTRHLAADMSRGDLLALNKFIGSALLASLGYAGRVYMFSGGDEEVIEERLALDRVIANGIAYSVSAGAIPALVDTVSYQLTGGFTPFNRFRTTGMSDNLSPLETFGVGTAPAVGVLQDYARAGTIVTQGFWDKFSGEDVAISREQMKALYTVIGADTLWFLRPLKEYHLAQLPKERELDRGNILTATGLDE